MSALRAQRRPCANCPWRTDVASGEFTVAKFRELANTARDMSIGIFTCHKTPDGREKACAGFLERGADHNLAVRLAYACNGLERRDRAGGLDLYADYRSMAVANGVEPDDPALEECR